MKLWSGRARCRCGTRIGTLAVTVALGGCIPAPVGTYYEPLIGLRDVHYTGAACHGQSGAPAVAQVALAPGVQARIDAMELHGAPPLVGRPMHIGLDVAPGTDIQFEGREARISVDGGRTWRPLALRVSVGATVSTPFGVAMAPWAPTSLDAIVPGTFAARAYLAYSLPDFAPDRLTMTIPAIELDSGIELSEMAFDARQEPKHDGADIAGGAPRQLIYTTAASRHRLAQRVVDCQRKITGGNKGLHCDRIRDYDDGGFESVDGPFTVSGRWYVNGAADRAPLNGELQIEYRQPLDWRFARGSLLLRDAQGRSRYVPTTAMRMTFDYDIALDAKVRGLDNVPLSSPTTVNIVGELLPLDVPMYRVQLPTLKVNGTRVKLPPIDFRRRLLGFELAPFNC